jgi:hypothetical protein
MTNEEILAQGAEYARKLSGMDRVDVVLALIEARGYKSYLEIGCQKDVVFSRVSTPVKVGVDPFEGGTLRMTSDDYFASLGYTDGFDIIFIDGDHRHPQVQRDLKNALLHLNGGGTVVMHDCLPPNRKFEQPTACGTAWRAFAEARQLGHLDAITGDFDYGVGIIRRGMNPDQIELPTTNLDDLTFDLFQANRERWMRPRSAEQVLAFIREGL